MPSANDKTADTDSTKGADAGTSTTSSSADVAAASAGVQGQQTGQPGLGVGLRAQLPTVQTDPRRLLWWGGLAAAGVVGLVEWPVVAAVGVGSWVAEQFAKEDIRRGG